MAPDLGLERFRLALLGAVGLALACGPAVDSDPMGGDSMGGSSGSDGASESGGPGSSDGSGPSSGGTTGGGSGGSDGTVTTGASASSDGTGTTPSDGCENPEPIMQAGADGGLPTGYVRCENGEVRRIEPANCQNPMPAGTACPDGGSGGCTTDADCSDQPYGRCVTVSVGGFAGGGEFCGCAYGCGSDDDCFDGATCACGGIVESEFPDYPTGSQCITATCETSEECESGACAVGWDDDGCGVSYSQACHTEADECHVATDCEETFGACMPGDMGWRCVGLGACGRPLIVDGRGVLAPLCAGTPGRDSGWIDRSVRPCVVGLDPASRRALALHWSEAALMEHASIASFARFDRQLEHLGAPPELRRDATRAIVDETDHARRCFALASAYEGRPLVPGVLPEPDGPVATDPCTIVDALVEEACIGETLAAIEADRAARLARDPDVADTLRRIAADELRHATLGWRTLAWMLAEGDASVRTAAVAAMRRGLAHATSDAARGPAQGDPAALRAHGVLGSSERRALVARAIDDVLVPCFGALLVEASAPQRTAERSAMFSSARDPVPARGDR